MPTERTEVADQLAQGWSALARGDWDQARSRFAGAFSSSSVTDTDESASQLAAALEGLSWSAWWLDDTDTVFDYRERAYRAYRELDDRTGAARMAIWLGTDHVDWRGELAVARGWLSRARRLLTGVQPSPEHGWLDVHEAEKHMFVAHDTARAGELGARAAELGRTLAEVDLEMMGLATEGLARVTQGDVDEGMSRLDEALAVALGEDGHQLWATGWCCCYMIHACERVRDYDRAAQWCAHLDEWSARMRVEFLNRSCRAHYAGVLIWRGTWDLAEQELTACARRLGELRPPMAAEATVRLGELRRRQGDLDQAADIFEQVADHPLALLGLAEVRLDRGDPVGARDRAEQYLRGTPRHAGTLRAAGLEVLVRAHAALGEREAASTALEELRAITALIATDPLRASTCYATGIVASVSDDQQHARAAFEDATRLFHRTGAPFEAARAHAELARVLEALGRPRDAVRETRAAAVSLRRLGAEFEAQKADRFARCAGRETGTAPPRLTGREREVLCLVAEGMSDRAIAAQLVLSEHTVHRHMANILAKLGCASRSAAVAEAFRTSLL